MTAVKVVVKTKISGKNRAGIQTNETELAVDDEMTSGDDESDTNTIHDVSDVGY